MNYDPSHIATRDLNCCETCQYEARTQDKFCRRCGAKLDGSRALLSPLEAYASARSVVRQA
jgi:predicted amidophosphoribosyltransferase